MVQYPAHLRDVGTPRSPVHSLHLKGQVGVHCCQLADGDAVGEVSSPRETEKDLIAAIQLAVRWPGWALKSLLWAGTAEGWVPQASSPGQFPSQLITVSSPPAHWVNEQGWAQQEPQLLCPRAALE